MITQLKIVRAHLRALRAKAAIERYSKNLEEAKGVLATLGSGKHQTEYGYFTVSENNVYSKEKMEALLSKSAFNKCSERKLVNAKVKILYPAIYESVKEERGYKVSLDS